MPPASSKKATTDAARIVEHVPFGIALVDADHIVLANRALHQMLGCGDRGSLAGMPLAQLVVSSVPEDGNAREERWTRADGSVALLHVSRASLPDGGQLLTVRDLAQEVARDTPLLIADRLASVGTLATGLAHQINNPLAYIIANLGYLADELPALVAAATAHPEDPAHAERLDVLVRAIGEAREGAERVASIVRDLKLLSRIDDDDTAAIDVGAVLASACNLVWPQLQERAQVVRTHADLPPVRGNASRLAKALVALLLNAAQAIPEGRSARNVIRIATSTDAEGNVVIEVADTGEGIPPELLARIFDPFFTTRAVGTGVGLGLTVAHGIVTSLGGRIVVDTTRGVGSKFRVLLPSLPRASSATASPDETS